MALDREVKLRRCGGTEVLERERILERRDGKAGCDSQDIGRDECSRNDTCESCLEWRELRRDIVYCCTY